MTFIEQVQTALNAMGFNCGEVDGDMGPKTEKAIIAFKKSIGFRARPYLGPKTLAKLGIKTKIGVIAWLNEMSKYMGIHEEEAQLKAWLEEVPEYHSDPDNIPWCASAMTVCIKKSMPNEPLTGRLAKNTSLALNWLDFGKECDLSYGAIVVMWRGKPTSWQGHLTIAIGYDPIRKKIRVRGGNQRDMVCDIWIDEYRVREHGYRVPITYKGMLPAIPIMNSAGAIISTNEA